MKKLKLEELVPYLPHRLKAEMMDYEIDYVGKQVDDILGVHQWDKNGKFWCALTAGGSNPDIDRIKPILRPLASLTKEIEHNGERFVMKDKLRNKYPAEYMGLNPATWSYRVIQELLKYHFDIHGLIERGLAVEK